MPLLPAWILLAVAAILIALSVRAQRKQKRIHADLARGLFYHRELKPLQRVWCLMEKGHAYEIQFLRREEGRRLYDVRKLMLDGQGNVCVTDVHSEVSFRHEDLRVGGRFVCEPGPLSSTISEIALHPVRVTRAVRQAV